MSPYPFVVDSLALAAYLVVCGFEYRLAGEKRFAFTPDAEAAAQDWQRRADARAKSTGSVSSRRFLPKS